MSSTRQLHNFGVIKAEEMVLSMGPQHPSTHGVLRLKIRTDGEVVSHIEPHLGYLHRCFEKHCENVTYPQVIPYVDRCDYLASMNNSHVWVMAVEKLMGLELPERVEYIRVIMAELQRIASHMMAVGAMGLDLGGVTPITYTFRDRERILDLFEYTCGARLLYNYMWIGGLSHDLPPDFVKHTHEFLDWLDPQMKEYDRLLTYNKIFIERTADVGVLPADVAVSYGCSGPVLRGSGVDWDLRKNEPYSIYDRFDFDTAVGRGEVGTVGDCWDRYWIRMEEMRQSARIVRQALAGLPKEGDVHAAVPKKVRPPKGEIHFRAENPKGDLGFYIISDGSPKPYRVKMRSPAFCNLSVLGEIAQGWMLSDVVAILGSLDIVLGEIDR